VDIDAQNAVTQMGETGGRDAADIAKADDHNAGRGGRDRSRACHRISMAWG
jgi:hypothetical protein